MKKFFRLICIISIILMTTGCAKIEMDININKDKSMNLSIIEAFDKTLIEQPSGKDVYKTQIEEIKQDGFEVKEYNKDGMTGYQFTKLINNIDKVSTKDKTIGDLSVIFNDDTKNNEKLFTIKKGLFKNKYTTKLKSSDINSISEQAEILNSTTESETEYNDESQSTTIDPSLQIADDENNIDAEFSQEPALPTLTSLGIKTNITVNLPYKALSNNATAVENGGKKLTWELNSANEYIEFEFELYNMTIIYILIGFGILLLIAIGYFVFNKYLKDKISVKELKTIQKLKNINYKNLFKRKKSPKLKKQKDNNTIETLEMAKKKNVPKAKVEEVEVLDLNETSKVSYKKE